MPLPACLEGRLRLPAVVAPMFLTSGPELVIESCRAGLLGSFPALNQKTAAGFEAWLRQIKAALDADAAAKSEPRAPFAVNLIVHRSNPRLEEDLAICIAHEVPVIITSLGAVPEVIARVHGYGGVVFHDVISRRHVEKAAAAGVDGLVLVCAGAGGHGGQLNPFAFIAEARRLFSGTILLAGGLSRGEDILAAQIAGADLAYLGTRFIATREALAAPAYKAMIVASGSADIIGTPAISGIFGNFLTESLRAVGLDPNDLPEAEAMDVATELLGEHKAWRDIWSAGHGVAAIDDVPGVAELTAQLIAAYNAARSRHLTATG